MEHRRYRDRVGAAIFRFTLGTAFSRGVFNTDPHPGNFFVQRGGSVDLTVSGFQDTGAPARWRDNTLRLVPARVLQRTARAGETVRVPAATADYVVLLKERR